MSLNSSQVRGQDVHSVLAAVASNPSGSLLAWRHLQRHWAAIWTTFHSGSFTMGAIIKSVVSHFSTQFDYDQVKIYNMEKNLAIKTMNYVFLYYLTTNVLFKEDRLF